MDDLELVFDKIKKEITITNADVCNFIEELRTDDTKCQDLENWKRWLLEWQKQQNSLAKQTYREPDLLAMHKEVPWELIHEKAMLEEAKDNIFVYDKYRGHPNFWLTTEDVMGKTKKPCSVTRDKYPGNLSFDQHTCSTLSFGYYGLPKLLDGEKSLTGEYRQIELLTKWSEDKQVKQAKAEVNRNLKFIEPFKPDVDSLIVFGTKLGESPENERLTPKITVTKMKFEHKPDWWNDTIDSHAITPPILRIGRTLITSAREGKEFLWYISLSYNHKCKEGNRNIKTISLANQGSTVVHFKWCQIPPYSNKSLPLKYSLNDQPKFFFDQTDGTILPGKKVTIMFLFKCDFTGVFKEIWQLITEPAVHSSPLLFILSGISKVKSQPLSSDFVSAKNIDKYIKKCVKRTKLLAQMRKKDDRLLKEPSKILKYNELFTEREKFEYNNPTLYYNTHDVSLLKKINQKLMRVKWNYSLRDLYNAILTVEDETKKEKYLHLFVEASRSLQSPPVFDYVSNSRYNTVYSMLCRFVNEMEAEFIGLEHVFNFRPLPRNEILYEEDSPLLPLEYANTDIEMIKGDEKLFLDVIKRMVLASGMSMIPVVEEDLEASLPDDESDEVDFDMEGFKLSESDTDDEDGVEEDDDNGVSSLKGEEKADKESTDEDYESESEDSEEDDVSESEEEDLDDIGNEESSQGCLVDYDEKKIIKLAKPKDDEDDQRSTDEGSEVESDKDSTDSDEDVTEEESFDLEYSSDSEDRGQYSSSDVTPSEVISELSQENSVTTEEGSDLSDDTASSPGFTEEESDISDGDEVVSEDNSAHSTKSATDEGSSDAEDDSIDGADILEADIDHEDEDDEEMRIMREYVRREDPKQYLANKKFINFIGFKRFQRRIKQKVCRNRVKFRYVLMVQCKILLTRAIDDIAAYLESTRKIDGDVQQVCNPLSGMYPPQ